MTRPRLLQKRVQGGLDAADRRGEDGATLILALIFVIVSSLILLSLVTLTGNDLLNSGNLRDARAVTYAADGATDAAILATRYSDSYYTQTAAPFGNCMPGAPASIPIDSLSMIVVCGNSTNSSLSSATRTVNFYTCVNVAVTSCSRSLAVLTAQVQYNDFSSTGFNTYECSATQTGTCGTGMTIASWVVKNANS
jgi:hypothetical protein